MLLPRAFPGRALAILTGLSLLYSVSAQSTSSASQTPTPTPSQTSSLSVSTSLSLTTSTGTSLSTSTAPRTTSVASSVYTTVFNVTYLSTATASSSASATNSSASASASATPKPITLDTKVDPAFGVLGALLIITGIPSAFLGHKNRWTSFFLIGFYTLSLTCFVLIVRFGILPAVNPPRSLLRGMFVLSSAVAGIVGGGIAIFFWKATRYGIGAWGGFAFGLWIECFRAGGLIDPIGYRYIMYIGCAVVGFTLATIARIHYHVVIVSTAIVGASAFMLGVDCFSTAGLKEFYMWNLGFKKLFPKFTSRDMRFPISQLMQIELGLMGAVALMGIAVQLRVLKILQRKLDEIKAEARRQDEAEEARAADRFAVVDLERDQWEKAHGRHESGYSSDMPLMRYQETPTDGNRSTLTMDPRARKQSNLSDFVASPRPEDELLRNVDGRRSQSPGVIPALDLGIGIEKDVPEVFMSEGSSGKNGKTTTSSSATNPEDAKKKEKLLAEINEIRNSIAGLKDVQDESQQEGAAARTRRISLASRRTLSQDLNTAVAPAPSHLRPPRAQDPRARVQSMELSNIARSVPLGEPISRPTSEPLQEDWDDYVRERKLMQPPSGVTPPIPTSSTPSPGNRMPVAPAVEEALADRRRRENAFELGAAPPARAPRAHTPTLDGVLAKSHARSPSSPHAPKSPTRRGHERGASSSSRAPVTILPPTTKVATPQPNPARTYTFDELQERHREKIKALQTPLSDAERERADLEKAKARWERSKTIEREAVTKRQAERAAAVEKEAGSGEKAGRRSNDRLQGGEHSRSLSADKLAVLDKPVHGSRRQSTLKVEGWQQRQQTGPDEGRRRSGELLQQATGQRGTKGPSAPAPAQEGLNGRRMSGPLRDPPS